MTNEIKKNYLYHKPLTTEAINTLKIKGYKFLQVQGFTLDHHAEYVEPHYLMLIPTKELPRDIYEPIDSDLVTEWINQANNNDRLEIYIANGKHLL